MGNESSTGNALLGGYLTQLGFPDSAIAYATSAGPESARWLTPSEAQRYGIEVKILETPSSNAPNPTGFTPVNPPSSVNSMQAEAERFIFQHLQTQSEPMPESLRRAASEYADAVFHYGKIKSKAEVLREFSAFISRWPARHYALRPGSTRMTCLEFNRTCSFEGVLEWTAESAERNKRSVGTSIWNVGLQKVGNTFVIVSVNGTVTDRRISDIQEQTSILGLFR
jgi:hypothetical protein